MKSRLKSPPANENGSSSPELESPENEDPTAAIQAALADLQGLYADASRYLSITGDRIEQSLRWLVVRLVVGAVVALILLVLLVTALVLLLRGIAGALGALLSEPTWLGELLVGGLVVAAFATAGWGLIAWRRRRILETLREKYRADEPTADRAGHPGGVTGENDAR